MRNFNEIWLRTFNFMCQTGISLNEMCIVYDISMDDLKKYDNDDYDVESDPNTEKIKKILDYYDRKEQERKIEERITYAKEISPKNGIFFTDRNEPL